MLCNKLKECKQQKNTIKEISLPEKSLEKETWVWENVEKMNYLVCFRTTSIFQEENKIKQENESLEINYLKEENYLLRDIIDQAATSIADVVQV